MPMATRRNTFPLATKALVASGQKRLASGGRTISLSGPPPASRVVVSTFDSLEKAQAAYISLAYLEARKVGDQYGKLRILPSKGDRNRRESIRFSSHVW
jgi:uncharacterized protein (DUF1330 family)